jgi:hypothetical protein
MTDLHTEARRHIDAARSFGWTCESMTCDYAQAALEAQGRDPDLAADAVRAVWDEMQQKEPKP